MKCLARPEEAGQRVRKTLQGVFEAYYQFDLDFLKKENLGKSIQQFEKFRGVTPFVISYVAQHGLGGHSIPVEKSMLLLCYALGIISESEATKGKIPGLERTIPKSKGIDFAALVHPFAVEYSSAPFSKAVRDKILKLAPDAAERFLKRASKKKPEEKAAAPAPKVPVVEKADSKKASVKKTAAAKAAPAKKSPAAKKSAPAKKATTAKKAAPKKATPKKAAAKKPVKKKAAPKKPVKKKAAPKKKPAKKKASAKTASPKKTTKRKK